MQPCVGLVTALASFSGVRFIMCLPATYLEHPDNYRFALCSSATDLEHLDNIKYALSDRDHLDNLKYVFLYLLQMWSTLIT